MCRRRASSRLVGKILLACHFSRVRGRRRQPSATTSSNSRSSRPIVILDFLFLPRRTQHSPSAYPPDSIRVRQFCDGTALACLFNTRHLSASRGGIASKCGASSRRRASVTLCISVPKRSQRVSLGCSICSFCFSKSAVATWRWAGATSTRRRSHRIANSSLPSPSAHFKDGSAKMLPPGRLLCTRRFEFTHSDVVP
jgi:hypothetical protein